MSTIAAPISVSQVESFQTVRPRLFGIAYRILGSAAEADEVVQDTWIRWHGTEKTEVHDPAAFLATVTTRLAINVSQSARGRRETPLGSWLPERIDEDADPARGTERGEALEHAVQLLLEKLTPAERAVFVLREAFDYPYRRVSEVLGLSEPNTRQIASRARRRLAGEHRAAVDAVAQRRLLEAVVSAARDGHLAALEQVLVASLRDPQGRTPVPADQGPGTRPVGCPDEAAPVRRDAAGMTSTARHTASDLMREDIGALVAFIAQAGSPPTVSPAHVVVHREPLA